MLTLGTGVTATGIETPIIADKALLRAGTSQARTLCVSPGQTLASGSDAHHRLQAPAERARTKFVSGATLAEIQAANPRPIKRSTIVTYLAAAAARHPDGVDFARLAKEAGLTYDAAAAISSGEFTADLVFSKRSAITQPENFAKSRFAAKHV